MADTTWVLADRSGKPVGEFANASVRQFIAKRNAGRQGVVTMTHDDREAFLLFEQLKNGVPQLRYYRNGTLRLSAYLTAIDESLSEDGDDQLVATFKDPFGRIYGDGSEQGRHVYLPANQTLDFSNEDQGEIAWQLIERLNLWLDTGLRRGEIEVSAYRDRSYAAGKNVGEAISQLTEVIGGFDFEVLPLDPTKNGGKLGEFTVYQSQGQDRPDLLWGFGKGTMANVRSLTRKWTPPINRSFMLTSDGLWTDRVDMESLARWGEWGSSTSAPNDIVLQGTLDEAAADLLRPEWVRVLSFAPDPDLGPQPFDDYWLGDTGRFKGLHGAFDDAFVPRVNALTITEDEDDNEAHELEVEVYL